MDRDERAHPTDFERNARALVEWITAYQRRIESLPVLSRAAPGDVRAALPTHPPQHGEPFERVIEDLDRVILPGVTHWQSPGFFGYFPANSSAPAVLGDLLGSALGVQGMLWSTSPACTELEQHVLDWLVEMMGLPTRFRNDGGGATSGAVETATGGGVIQDTASSALLCAVVAARERATDFTTDRDGLGAWPRSLVAYATAETHSSLVKDLRIAGLGERSLRLVPVDAAHAMDPAALDEAIRADLAAGRQPFLVCATVGTTSTHAVDPVLRISEVSRRHGLWLHVDAAHAGSAAICPEFRWIVDGAEHADSWSFNPHKWMGVTFDCSILWVPDRRTLVRSLSVLPEYLRNSASESGRVVDYRDWQIPLGRRFRALKLWFVIRAFGVDGLRALIREHVRLAQRFRGWVEEDPEWEVVAPAPLSLVCIRYRGRSKALSGADATSSHAASAAAAPTAAPTDEAARLDALNACILRRVNESGRAFITHTRIGGRFVIRVSIGSLRVEERHVRELWSLLRDAAEACLAES